MHQVNDITGRGRYLIETANCLISVEVLLHPTGGYTAYTDVSRSIPLCALGAVAGQLQEIERRIDWLNTRQSQIGGGLTGNVASEDEVVGAAV